MFFMGDMPEEMKEAMRQQADRNEMIAQAMRHDTYRFVTEMESEDLSTFNMILDTILSEGGASFAAYLRGISSGVLLSRNVCPGCGVNHEKELLDEPE
jgi:hypothetical protein